MVNVTSRPFRFTLSPGIHCIGGGWAPEPVWTGEENLVPAVIRCPDRPSLSETLYRLRYPGLPEKLVFLLISNTVVNALEQGS
jgi:hypothetical protein